MVKQIRNCEVVERILDKGKGYFHWLQRVSGLTGPLSSMLAETEFISVDGLDDNLMKKAKEEVRRKYADEIASEEDLNDKDAEALYKSIRGDCCLYEVMVCLSFSINEMFEDLDAYDGCAHFFGLLLKNSGLDLYDEEDLDTIGESVKEYWKKHVNLIIKREYEPSGRDGLFPLAWIEDFRDNRKTYTDRRFISLWQQMNDWVDEHTDEDGEWVD